MTCAQLNGIDVHYQVQGSGPALLLLAPGAFNAVIGNWTAAHGKNAWKEMDGLQALSRHHTVIAYDRREAGRSGGRVEPLTWDLYAQEALGVLQAAGFESAYLLGGCMGASLAAVMGARYPQACKGLLLHWPVGGYRWMLRARAQFDRHIGVVRAEGLAGVVRRARERNTHFWADAECGPWATLLARDERFAAEFEVQDPRRYIEIVERSRDALFPDALPSGARAEELVGIQTPALVMSGRDDAHAVSSAWTLRELMPNCELWDMLPPHQTGANTLEQILRFTQRLEHAA